LTPAAKFSDGSPVEAKDVKWSFERLKNVKGNACVPGGPDRRDRHAGQRRPWSFTLAASNSEFLNQASRRLPERDQQRRRHREWRPGR
jgi:peptide/nickel transport system substrate-binding protein